MQSFKEYLLLEKSLGNMKGRDLFKALTNQGWQHVRTKGSHRIMNKPGVGNFVFSFADHEQVGAPMLNRVARATGLDLNKVAA